MRIGRTLPPAAAPLFPTDLVNGCMAMLRPRQALRHIENDVKEYFGVRHCFFVSSGKAALALILRSLHEMHPDRDEAVIPAFDCFSVPSAIVNAGLNVRVCDVDPRTLDFNEESLDRVLSNAKKTLCVVPTHFFGIPADIDKLRTKLRGSGIMIVEDAAQAMGGIHNGKFLGTQGDAGFFSLSRGKAITSIEGGIIVTDDPRLASVLRAQIASLSSYGPFQQLKLLFSACALWLFLRPRLFWFPKLLPFVNFGETVFDPDFPLRRMSGLQAGLLRKWRKKLKLFSDMRMKVSELWSALPTTALDGHRRGPYAMEKGSLIRYPVFFKNQTIRDTLLSLSNKYGWGITRVYREPVTTIKALQIAENEKKAPGAQACAETLLTLPNHGFVTTNDVSRIEQCISHLQNNKKNNFPGIPK